MARSQDDRIKSLELDEWKRLFDLGASHDEEAVSLLIDRFSDRICRRLFTAMTEERISFAEASHRFGLACLQNFTDDQTVRLGHLLESEIQVCTGEVSD